ncbi:hypothetical protein H5410_029122 [Solanum commersonii]|uniref:Uncharacterized protein n=1 Tax=Solanum commersonii TaxID=4109 RepID=A0A9J5Z9L3_SOLCO|nr:hypothetical protein H5410_029122 [Solanum commersonii]
MLHLSIQEIYKICQAKNHQQLHEQLYNHLGAATYRIQMKKLFSRNRETSAVKLTLLNYEEKHNPTEAAAMVTAEATKPKTLDTSNKPSKRKHKTVIVAAPMKRD